MSASARDVNIAVADGGGRSSGTNHPTELRVTVHSASGLMAADRAGMFGTGALTSSDPYVKVTVGSDSRRTRTIKKSLEPVWEDSFTLPTPSAEGTIQVLVYDAATMSTFDAYQMGVVLKNELIVHTLERWPRHTCRAGITAV